MHVSGRIGDLTLRKDITGQVDQASICQALLTKSQEAFYLTGGSHGFLFHRNMDKNHNFYA